MKFGGFAGRFKVKNKEVKYANFSHTYKVFWIYKIFSQAQIFRTWKFFQPQNRSIPSKILLQMTYCLEKKEPDSPKDIKMDGSFLQVTSRGSSRHIITGWLTTQWGKISGCKCAAKGRKVLWFSKAKKIKFGSGNFENRRNTHDVEVDMGVNLYEELEQFRIKWIELLWCRCWWRFV